MQTFLPYESFIDSAEILDNKRLGKQRVECLQILKALLDGGSGWKNHPAVRMWRGHEFYLCLYGLIVCKEWIRRGFNDTCHDKIRKYLRRVKDTGPPPWLGRKEFHRSHRSNLKRKDADHYGLFKVGPNLPYVWPV